MNKHKLIIKKIILTIVFFIVTLSALPAKAQELLTKKEQDYINKKNTIKAVSLNGIAPLQYTDKNGQVKGISKEVLETISSMTGLIFTYQLYDTLNEVMNSGADIVFGIPRTYTPKDMPMSIPFLETDTVLYINSSIDPNELDNKKYAAVEGGDLPEGIKEENTIYYKTRVECMDAVEKGEADYGYGNAYSVAFYTIQNSYRNIITVPDRKESRKYCIGFLKDDETLLSIINKSIDSIDEAQMSNLILNTTTQIERKITFQMIINAYGVQIFGAIFLIFAILLLSAAHNIRVKNELKIQYERYQMLSQTSNEYLYEYNIRTKCMELSKNCIELFGNSNNLCELKAVFDQSVISTENTISTIELSIADGKKGLFRSVNTPIYDDKGRVYSIIGKLIDISEEEAEKQELIKKSEIDGLTGLYNATTTRNLITESIERANSNTKDALIIIDCDNFKSINDTYGHLQGDKVLQNISKGLIQTFRKTDIIGRIGGDELCVYMKDIPSLDFVVSKCQQLIDIISKLNQEPLVTISIGISLLGQEKTYDDLFKKADKALYDAKKKGRNQIQF